MRARSIFLFPFFLILAFISIVSTDSSSEFSSNSQIQEEVTEEIIKVLDKEIIYRVEQGYKKSIIVRSQDGEELISEDTPSKPEFTSEKKRFSYIAPFEWEAIGQIYIYDLVSKKKNKVDLTSVPNQFSPKKVVWYDDRFLFAIIGYGYGTVSVGGDLYVYDTRENKLNILVKAQEHEEIKDILITNQKVKLQVAVFNNDYSDYSIEERNLEIKYLKLTKYSVR